MRGDDGAYGSCGSAGVIFEDELAFAGGVFGCHFFLRGRDEVDGGIPWLSSAEGAVGIFGEPRGEAFGVEFVGAGEADDERFG